MPNPPTPALSSEAHLTFRRSGLASFLFAIVRPADAKAAALNADALTLTLPSRSLEIPLEDIETVELEDKWRWRGVRIRCASREQAVSGLSRGDATALAEALEAARVLWWRMALEAHAGPLRSVHDRLARLADPPGYTTRGVFSDLRRDAGKAASRFPSRWPDGLRMAPEFRMLKEILDFLQGPDRVRTNANKTFIENELTRSREFFDTVETRPLTDEQRRAVVIDEERNLIVAAAGSGKTSVIVAKAGWLVRRGYRRPSELLLLAFAKDARKELEERVRRRLGKEAARGMTVRTFHSLGMSIIGEAEGRRPTLAKAAEDEKALLDLLKRIVAELLADRKFSGTLLKWFQERFAPYKSEHEFRTQGEYWDYIRRHEIRSLKGEKVKSLEECEIANFLYLNGVPYEYERDYEHDTATPDRRQYQPDFHLLEAGIYIEHFALSSSGDTPPFIDREEYLRSRDWKRRLHAEHGTVLIETFSHEHAAGALTRNLAEKLGAHGVTLSPIPPADIFAVLEEQGRIDPFTRQVATFLQHFKGSRLSFQEVARRAVAAADRPRAEAFLSVFTPIFERYQETLAELGQIDFHDMINKATDHAASGRYSSPFGYILVDEFQDISPGRARLLKALLDQSPKAQLFAVGDDWQAIFRFAGSDIAIMREFGERFGHNERVDLETTFRCSDRISGVASRFVLGNPAQIRKKVRSVRQADRPSVHVGLPGDERVSLLGEALNRIAADAAGHDGTSTVLLLGRYRHTRPQNMPGLAKEHPSLRLSYMTVHGSKGLEADYVVVLGLCSGRHGFPSEIADDPLLDLVLAQPEGHPNAEERRENARDGSAFYGCSNWPYCDHRQSSCPACKTGLPVKAKGQFRCRDCGQAIEGCPDCGGWLQPRIGKYGRFLGCTNWPDCSYTRDIRQQRPRNRLPP